MNKVMTITSIFLFALMEVNGEDAVYLDYAIAVDADKYGANATRESEVTYTKYFSKGANPENDLALLGVEYHRNGVLTKRELYKGGKLHGVQKKWHSNGGIEVEAPYKEGIMHGTFKHWNKTGRLIGQYKMRNGNGVKTIFFDNGNLTEVENYRENLKEGWHLEFYKNGNLKCVNKAVHGKYIPEMNVAFYGSGNLYLMAMSDDKEHLENGILIYFNEDETVQEIAYYLKGNKVDKEVYAEAKKKDAALPPVFENPQKYKELLSQEVNDLIESYKALKPVKIPLEFDNEGQIITKTGEVFTLPK